MHVLRFHQNLGENEDRPWHCHAMWSVGNDNLHIRGLRHYLVGVERIPLVPVLDGVVLHNHFLCSQAFRPLHQVCLTCFHKDYSFAYKSPPDNSESMDRLNVLLFIVFDMDE